MKESHITSENPVLEEINDNTAMDQLTHEQFMSINPENGE